MRKEVHVHADIPIVEGVTRKQLETALSPWLEYLDAETFADAKSLEQNEPGIRYDEKQMALVICWTGEIGRSFREVLEHSLANLGPYCEQAVEVDYTIYHDNENSDEHLLLFVGPTAQAIHEARRRCMIEDVAAVLGREFGDTEVGEVSRMVGELYDRAWRERGEKPPAKPERAFEYGTRPARKNLH